MFQPIQIETQSEQQGLAHLRVQGSTWCACESFRLTEENRLSIKARRP
jgi:hypothetical protein